MIYDVKIISGDETGSRVSESEMSDEKKPVGAAWKDVTSYARDGRGKVEPREWQVCGKYLTITIHGRHGLPGLWFVTCHDVGTQDKRLDAKNADAAKTEALEFVDKVLDGMCLDICVMRGTPRRKP